MNNITTVMMSSFDLAKTGPTCENVKTSNDSFHTLLITLRYPARDSLNWARTFVSPTSYSNNWSRMFF